MIFRVAKLDAFQTMKFLSWGLLTVNPWKNGEKIQFYGGAQE